MSLFHSGHGSIDVPQDTLGTSYMGAHRESTFFPLTCLLLRSLMAAFWLSPNNKAQPSLAAALTWTKGQFCRSSSKCKAWTAVAASAKAISLPPSF